MTTTDDMQAAFDKILAILTEMDQCVARVEEMLIPALCVGTVYLDDCRARPGYGLRNEWFVAWMQVASTFRIVVQLCGSKEWRPWAETSAQRRLEVFPKLPELVATIQRELERSLSQALECEALLPEIDTLLGAPAGAGGGEGES